MSRERTWSRARDSTPMKPLNCPVASGFSPPLDNPLKLRETIAQRGRPRLQDRRRFDFIEILVLHSRYSIKLRPRCNSLRPEFLAAPRADDKIGFLRDYLLSRHDAVFGGALILAIGEDVDAAGDPDKLRNPSNCRDQRIIPFLEEYSRPLRQVLAAPSGFG